MTQHHSGDAFFIRLTAYGSNRNSIITHYYFNCDYANVEDGEHKHCDAPFPGNWCHDIIVRYKDGNAPEGG
jgi:hypothetical protein